MKNIIIFGLLLSGMLWNASSLIAQSDKKISIQGILKDGDGAAVADGNYKLTFSLYTAAGTLKWTEDQPSVRVRGGVYSALLGTVKDFNTQGNTAIFDVPYFLGVKVNDGTELTPRTELSYSPYALAVNNAATATYATSAGSATNATNATNAINATNATNGRYVYQNGAYGGGAAYIEPSSLHVYYAANAGKVYQDGAVGGVGTYVPASNLHVYYAALANTAHSATTAGSATTSGTAGGLTGNPTIQVGGINIVGIPNWPVGTHGAGGAFRYMDLGSAGNVAGPPGAPAITGYSLVSVGRLAAAAFDAYSDKRIKTNILRSSPTSDIIRLNSLEVVDYQYIDKSSEGNRTKKGFIAQQVAEVFPEAVSYMQKKIPDVYALALSVEHLGSQTLITLDKEHTLKAGDKISLVTESKEELFVIKNCPSSTQFVVEGLDAAVDKIFVYGREVDDFHTIDDSMIFSLGISAIQQLVKQVSALEEENNALRAEQSDMKNMMQSMASRLDALEKTSVHVISGDAKSSSGQ